MRCERCGGPLGNRITRINGVTICDKCAQEMGLDIAINTPISSAFPILNELTNAIMASGNDLDFTKSKVSCPRCGTTLRDYENNGTVGCIECYSHFNENITKSLFRLQGSSEYKGRKPGEKSDILPEIEISESKDTKVTATTEKKTEKETTVPNKVSKDKKSLYEKLMKADLGMVPDEDLEQAMKQAASMEDYVFAAKLRDELKSRKGGEN